MPFRLKRRQFSGENWRFKVPGTGFFTGSTYGIKALPWSDPAIARRLSGLFPFKECWYWGDRQTSPLIHEPDRVGFLTDIAICKISGLPDGAAHQPLGLSLHPFKSGEIAYAIGYAEMEDIPIREGRPVVENLSQELYVSVGEAMEVFSDNHLKKHVPTPGPCFDFKARIPGKMSGGPIFGAGGIVVRGVISRSFSAEKHAYGAMLGPIMHLPLSGKNTLKTLMDSEQEGMAQIQGAGL